jgi:uncharacterized protein (TIGR03435 family)
MRRNILAVVVLAIVMAGATYGQQSPPPLKFDSASIRINKTASGSRSLGGRGGTYTASNVTLRRMVSIAYASPQPWPIDRIEGGPAWVDDIRFDVAATYDGSIDRLGGRAQARQAGDDPPPNSLMLRQLLADRFKLRVHSETPQRPIYALLLASPAGTLGRRLTPMAPEECGRPQTNPPCGLRMRAGNVSAGAISMLALANALSTFAGRPVIDKTGLTGTYSATLDYPTDQVADSLSKALEEQLGLRLEPQQGDVSVLVIDAVEMPKED